MTRNKRVRFIFALIMAAIMIVPATVVYADDYGSAKDRPAPEMKGPDKMGPGPEHAGTGPADPPPIAIRGPRLNPPAIPHSSVLESDGVIFNPPIPVQSLEADAADAGRTQESPGRGVRQTATGIGFGLTLYDSPNVCNNFNTFEDWAASEPVKTDIWTDWYAGWAPFAIDNGLYQAKNVVFTMERSVGPGDSYGPNEHSAKIASSQPYAAGYGSPRIPVPDGYGDGKVVVSVKYLIWDHDQGGKQGGPDGWDYDWASLGVKAGAGGPTAVYVNGYVRGEWAEMTNTVDIKGAPDIMVLLQGHSPASLNSNIFFDDVKIGFIDKDGNGKYLSDCRLEGSVN